MELFTILCILTCALCQCDISEIFQKNAFCGFSNVANEFQFAMTSKRSEKETTINLLNEIFKPYSSAPTHRLTNSDSKRDILCNSDNFTILTFAAFLNIQTSPLCKKVTAMFEISEPAPMAQFLSSAFEVFQTDSTLLSFRSIRNLSVENTELNAVIPLLISKNLENFCLLFTQFINNGFNKKISFCDYISNAFNDYFFLADQQGAFRNTFLKLIHDSYYGNSTKDNSSSKSSDNTLLSIQYLSLEDCPLQSMNSLTTMYTWNYAVLANAIFNSIMSTPFIPQQFSSNEINEGYLKNLFLKYHHRKDSVFHIYHICNQQLDVTHFVTFLSKIKENSHHITENLIKYLSHPCVLPSYLSKINDLSDTVKNDILFSHSKDSTDYFINIFNKASSDTHLAQNFVKQLDRCKRAFINESRPDVNKIEFLIKVISDVFAISNTPDEMENCKDEKFLLLENETICFIPDFWL